jgi:hypothetical protein
MWHYSWLHDRGVGHSLLKQLFHLKMDLPLRDYSIGAKSWCNRAATGSVELEHQQPTNLEIWPKVIAAEAAG